MLFIDIDWHEVFRLFSGNSDERFIAFRTASERLRKHVWWKNGKDLLHLCTDIVARDEQVVVRHGPGSEAGILRQDYAVLLERKADDVVVIERPVVKDVESEQPHPLRKPAQHYIGDEFHRNLLSNDILNKTFFATFSTCSFRWHGSFVSSR